MNTSLSLNTQAILLLTAPLMPGRADASDLLAPGEYKRLARFLRDHRRQPAEFFGPDAQELLAQCQSIVAGDRLKKLLTRGLLLSHAIERWQARALWVVSRADPEYPKQLKARLRDDAPPILYGCGDTAILETGGLAVVGSRDADEAQIEFAQSVGRLVAAAKRTLVSGGARGIDQAAMLGALEAGGRVAGVLADSLERAALNREHRSFLREARLALVSPYDPIAGFNVGHAMQRNKLIYALSDAALVVSAEYQKGGTWTGAVEQVDKFKSVPVYVRSSDDAGEGLAALRRKGALPWPNPEVPEELAALLTGVASRADLPIQDESLWPLPNERTAASETAPAGSSDDALRPRVSNGPQTPAEELLAKVRELLCRMTTAKTDADVASEFQVSRSQAREWLQRMVDEGLLEKLSRPVRYRVASAQVSLFGRARDARVNGERAHR